jgi:hypothetical protein
MQGGGVRALAGALAVLLVVCASAGCGTSNHRRPRTLAMIGAAVALGGSGVWAFGERRADPGTVPAVGLGIVAAGVVGMIASGAWMAAQVACQADPDCLESEECREIPAPPGGVPYKQCSPR